MRVRVVRGRGDHCNGVIRQWHRHSRAPGSLMPVGLAVSRCPQDELVLELHPVLKEAVFSYELDLLEQECWC